MKFDWDENKNQINITKHGIDFNDVSIAFENPMLIKKDDRKEYNEVRFIGIGKISSVEIVVVWTVRKNTIRIISVRQANKKERKIYNDKINKD